MQSLAAAPARPTPPAVPSTPFVPSAIFVINLARRPDRWSTLYSRLQRTDLANVPLYRVEARDSSAEDFTKLMTEAATQDYYSLRTHKIRHYHAQLSQGALGCYLSHLDTWKSVASMNLPPDDPVLILEDDAEPNPKMQAEMRGAWPALLNTMKPGQPTIVLWSVLCMVDCKPLPPASAPAAPKRSKKQKGFVLRPGMFWGAQAYSITPRSAAQLLTLPWLPIDMQFDLQFQVFRNQGRMDVLAVPILKVGGAASTDIQVPIVNGAPMFRPGSGGPMDGVPVPRAVSPHDNVGAAALAAAAASSNNKPKPLSGGAIAGITIAALLVALIIAVAVYMAVKTKTDMQKVRTRIANSFAKPPPPRVIQT
jgi:GR25 family glycosyltransferase involved in LPS biosynthesis